MIAWTDCAQSAKHELSHPSLWLKSRAHRYYHQPFKKNNHDMILIWPRVEIDLLHFWIWIWLQTDELRIKAEKSEPSELLHLFWILAINSEHTNSEDITTTAKNFISTWGFDIHCAYVWSVLHLVSHLFPHIITI